MEPYFADQCRTLTEKIRALREPDNLCFALLAGTAVSDFADHTDENIRAVDAQTHFDGVIHLGDILTAASPKMRPALYSHRSWRGFRMQQLPASSTLPAAMTTAIATSAMSARS